MPTGTSTGTSCPYILKLALRISRSGKVAERDCVTSQPFAILSYTQLEHSLWFVCAVCILHHEHQRTKLERGTRVVLLGGGIFFWTVKNRASPTVTERVPVSKRHRPAYDLKSLPSSIHDSQNATHSIPLPPYPAASNVHRNRGLRTKASASSPTQ